MHSITDVVDGVGTCRTCGRVPVYGNGKRSYSCSVHSKMSVRRAHGLNGYERQALLGDKPVCEICGKEVSGRDAHIDHDHETGRIRGILCARCNRGIGLFHDDPALLLAAAAYLNQ